MLVSRHSNVNDVDSLTFIILCCQAVRQAACKCLKSFAKLPVERIIPYKVMVTRGLKPALDDPKRRVRRVAADAANAYHFLAV